MDSQQNYALELLKRRLLELEQTQEVETKMLKDFVEFALSQTAVLESK